MIEQFVKMLRIFGSASIKCDNYDCLHDINVDAIIDCACKQGIWTVIYPAIKHLPQAQKYHMFFLKSVSDSVRQNEYTLGVIEKMQMDGFNVCLLKGVVVASLYPNPECRISSDTDILIKPSDESRVMKWLLKNGYNVTPRRKNEHHFVAIHPVGGILEVHTLMYGKVTDRVIFAKSLSFEEPWREITLSGKKFYTLGINDNLKYLTAHYIKHFIQGEASVRQMMDLLLYIKNYESQIDFEAYNQMLRDLRYFDLIESVKTIGALYFGLDFPVENKKLAQKLLDDCERFGAFGANSKIKGDYYNQFCMERNEMSKFKLKSYRLFNDELTLFNKIFPRKPELLKRGYKYASHTLLIPVAWINNIFDYIFKRRKTTKQNFSSQLLKERQKLMQELNMIN